ncbi:ATP-binding protein [Pontibacter sp. G13]|uniref:ATP-binding protein n=1 Tax=Pontibacter sp. G13 TaxID=3074898 RepID=UPI00288AE5C5|nr:ATP-binding protein [Pontibacter sp. G13]WNJ21199.1 ATP-binding protein [Pontibacter sp. G13]
MRSYLRVRCNKKHLATIRAFVKSRLADLQIVGNVSNQIVLAVDEACANCMIHQHQCDGRSVIEVSLYQQNDTLYTEVKDTGRAFPLDEFEPKQIQELVHKRGKGGLGISLIHKIMDEIRVEEGHDCIIYKFGKRIAGNQSPS